MEKKTIKLCFIGYLPEAKPLENRLFTNDLIRRKYNFVIDVKNPDYVFVGSYGDRVANIVAYNDKVKIWYIEEPFSSDFVFFDYCIGFEPYDYGGRNIFYPDCLHGLEILDPPSFEEAKEIVKQKKFFCCMTFSHETHDKKRKKYYDLLSSYKRVESAGTFLNNQPNHETVNYVNGDNSKFELLKNSKFDLCVQTLNYDWFINEKIVHSIINNSIPIFYGTEKVKQIFNPKRFIFVGDFESEQELLNRIIEIDKDDALYASIISEQPFITPTFQQDVLNNAFSSLDRIFESNCVKKRNTLYATKYLYNELVLAAKWNTKRKKREKSPFNKIKKTMSRFVRKVGKIVLRKKHGRQ